MQSDLKSKLLQLYKAESKHSSYQQLAPSLARYLGQEAKAISDNMHEEARAQWVCERLSLENQTIMDIGGNTGYFALMAIEKGAKKVRYIEGNPTHAEFVSLASKALDLEAKIQIDADHYGFDEPPSSTNWNAVFCLNVVHHLGDDFGDPNYSMVEAKENMLRAVRNLAKVSNNLIFQMGFNWKGDRNRGLFAHGLKSEMIDFLENGVAGCWKIAHTGIAVRQGDTIAYEDANSVNLKRDDSLGEFLNRPLFLLQAS